jgi:hypothetical protein
MMTLQSRVSELDDYSGELTQALDKLGIERARGALNRDEQLDFLGDLRRAMDTRDLLPLKRRGRNTLLAGLALAGGSAYLPLTVPYTAEVQLGLLVLAAICLVISGWNFIRYIRVRRRDKAWLGKLEATAAKGGTIFDVA